MRLNRRGLYLILVVLGGLLIYALSPLWSLFLVTFRAGAILVLAVPQIIWWFIGVMLMIVWGGHLLFRLGKSALPSERVPLPLLRSSGRLNEIRRSLSEADAGMYSQDKVRQLLSSLAIDLISLRLDLSEEEARKVYFLGEWTEDEKIRAYFDKQRDTTVKGRRPLSRLFKKLEPTPFLRETGEVLDRLKYYSRSFDGGKFDETDGND